MLIHVSPIVVGVVPRCSGHFSENNFTEPSNSKYHVYVLF